MQDTTESKTMPGPNWRLLLSLAALLLALAACNQTPAQDSTQDSESATAAEQESSSAPDTEPEEAETEETEPADETTESSAGSDEDSAESSPEEADADASSGEGSQSGAELPAGTQTFVIDAGASTAYYIADEEFFGDAMEKYGIPVGTQDTTGSTQEIEGQFELNWDNLAESPLGENQFTVDLSTLSSNQMLRDRWIRNNGPEFNTYPNATFVATELQNAPDSYTMGEEVTFQMAGDLTLREVTQPATFDITATLNDGTVTGAATTTTLMSDFGIEPPNFVDTLTVNDEVQIRLEFTAHAE